VVEGTAAAPRGYACADSDIKQRMSRSEGGPRAGSAHRVCYHAHMRAVVDSSSWISLARAGLLDILATAAVEPVLLDVVRAEIVDEGRRGGHADAASLSAALAGVAPTPTKTGTPVDVRVLEGARAVGLLVANDLALGRRARSLGVAWIRTADLIVIAVRTGSLSLRDGEEALQALHASGRITRELADSYMEQLK
jgi:hypothetical protein